MTGKYDDIIGLPHPEPKTHPRMPMDNRAAQFSPFAALTGYEEVIAETRRLTQTRIELDEGRKEELNRRLQYIDAHIDDRPEVEITYFCPDLKKAGGEYLRLTSAVRRLDKVARLVELSDHRTIPMEDILSLEGDFFAEL